MSNVMSSAVQAGQGTVSFTKEAALTHALLNRAGALLSRYGLVMILFLIGAEKFTPAEAEGIRPLIVHSPLMAWMYSVMGLQAVSNLIGVIEISSAALMALRPFSARASFFGSLGATATFLITVSFLFTTPGVLVPGHWFPLLGDAGQFLIKDLALLGAAVWTAAETFNATPWARG
jgi:uncharacterized membrane protein YkgB